MGSGWGCYHGTLGRGIGGMCIVYVCLRMRLPTVCLAPLRCATHLCDLSVFLEIVARRVFLESMSRCIPGLRLLFLACTRFDVFRSRSGCNTGCFDCFSQNVGRPRRKSRRQFLNSKFVFMYYCFIDIRIILLNSSPLFFLSPPSSGPIGSQILYRTAEKQSRVRHRSEKLYAFSVCETTHRVKKHTWRT